MKIKRVGEAFFKNSFRMKSSPHALLFLSLEINSQISAVVKSVFISWLHSFWFDESTGDGNVLFFVVSD